MAGKENESNRLFEDEKVIEIEIERLRSFKDHPFKVTDDKEMHLLKDSIKQYGVLNPLIVRPVPDGVYEIISGHRRKYAAQLLGYRKVPVIIRVMNDEESRAQIQRFIRLTELIPDLLEMVDMKRLNFTIAVDISYIPKDVQKWIYEYICDNGFIKPKQIAALRKYLEQGTVTQSLMICIMNNSIPVKAPARKITFNEKKLTRYFPQDYTTEDMEKVIEALLEKWKQEQEEM